MAQAVGSRSKRKASVVHKNKGAQITGSSSSGDATTRRSKACALALDVVRRDLSQGTKIVNWKDIQGILDAYVEKFLPSNPFDVLATEDLFQIYIDTHNPSTAITVSDLQPSPGQASIRHGQPTPEGSLSERDVPLVDVKEDDEPIEPMDGEQGEPQDLVFYCPPTGQPTNVRGRRYKCRNSYITKELVARKRLVADKGWPDSIRLTWFESNMGDKTKCTRFYFIDDDMIKGDIAIGQNHKVLDPDPAPLIDDDLEGMSSIETEDDEDQDDVSMQGNSEITSNSEMGDRRFVGLTVPEVDGLYDASRGRPRMPPLQTSSHAAMVGKIIGHAAHTYTMLSAEHRTSMPLDSGLDRLTLDNAQPSKRRKRTVER